MSKVFKASGVLYTAGYKVGTSGYTIADDYLMELIQKSPKKVPVVDDIGKVNTDPNAVIGHATIWWIPPYEGYPAYLRADIVFNQDKRKEWESRLQSSKERRRYHLGFYLTGLKFNSEDHQLRSGVISAISLSETGMGGIVDKFGWEEEE